MKNINPWRHLIEIFQNDKFSAARLFLILSIITFLAGCFFVIGALKKWRFLVDPEEWGPFQQFYKMKQMFGEESLKGYIYFMGVIFILVGGIFIVLVLGGTPVTWKK